MEIYFQTGKPASQIYEDQKRQKLEAAKLAETDRNDSTDLIGQMRYPTLLFWTHATKETLHERLNARVDCMIDQGLMPEAEQMSRCLEMKYSQGISVDKTRGVWVAIGYKEIEPYLEALQSSSVDRKHLEALKKECIERIKTSTRQYATRQLKWIRNKLYRALADIKYCKNLFLLDTTDVDSWEDNVRGLSERIARRFLEGGELVAPKTLSGLAQDTLGNVERDYLRISSTFDRDVSMTKQMTCSTCKKTMYGQEQWESHIQSRSHKRALVWASKNQFEYFLRNQETSSEDIGVPSSRKAVDGNPR